MKADPTPSPAAHAHFSDPEAVARYAEGPPRFVPGYNAMQRMAELLIAERVPERGRVLVLGAGGGLELAAFAAARPGWTFDGVDPSAEMLALAERTMGPLAPRARLHRGYAEDAPEGPFDAATCLLTMHFMSIEERRAAAAAMHRRLRPGAPFIVAHLGFPQADGARARWLARYSAFTVASGLDPEKARSARAAVDAQTVILAPGQDEAILREAGFADVELFYAAFSFRGWVGYA